MAAETETLKLGKLHKLSTGKWFVHCKWCEKESRLPARNEEEAYGMLEEWRLSMPKRQEKYRFWACPTCAAQYEDKKTITVAACPTRRGAPPPPPGAPPPNSVRPPDPPGLERVGEGNWRQWGIPQPVRTTQQSSRASERRPRPKSKMPGRVAPGFGPHLLEEGYPSGSSDSRDTVERSKEVALAQDALEGCK